MVFMGDTVVKSSHTPTPTHNFGVGRGDKVESWELGGYFASLILSKSSMRSCYLRVGGCREILQAYTQTF